MAEPHAAPAEMVDVKAAPARRVPTTPGPAGARPMLALALDFDDSVVAVRWAHRLKPYFGVAKVGLELFSATGPSVVAELVDDGFAVFLDLKLADIPNTCGRAARVLGALGISYLTVHTFAGPEALRAVAEGLAEGARRAGLPAPVALGVTVLTSEAEAPRPVLAERVCAAEAAGCGGVVCAASDLGTVRELAPQLLAVVPGIRPTGAPRHDQSRAATPAQAVRAGAGLLVVGRAVTEAADPEAAAAAIALEAAGAC